MTKLLITCLGAAFLTAQPAFAQQLSFGDDKGEWANDGECDDPRFSGKGMTGTALLYEDLLHDASDCRAAYDAGNISLRGIALNRVDFGDDNGEYANDGECDDMRFTGIGMTSTDLIADDIMHDATDCKTAFDKGRLSVLGVIQ